MSDLLTNSTKKPERNNYALVHKEEEMKLNRQVALLTLALLPELSDFGSVLGKKQVIIQSDAQIFDGFFKLNLFSSDSYGTALLWLRCR